MRCFFCSGEGFIIGCVHKRLHVLLLGTLFSCQHPIAMLDSIANCILLLTQFYTFLETSLVTLSLLPYFVAFFSDGEIPGTPGMVATTFLAFGEV